MENKTCQHVWAEDYDTVFVPGIMRMVKCRRCGFSMNAAAGPLPAETTVEHRFASNGNGDSGG